MLMGSSEKASSHEGSEYCFIGHCDFVWFLFFLQFFQAQIYFSAIELFVLKNVIDFLFRY